MMTGSSTSMVEVGQIVPDNWLKTQQRLTKEAYWTVTDQDAFIVGVPLINNFGKTVGGVALRSSKAYHQSKVQSMFIQLSKIFFIAISSFGILTILIVFLFFREITRSFAKMSASLQKTADNPSVMHEDGISEKKMNMSELEQHVCEFKDKSEEALAALYQVQQTLKTLEERT
ncbi:hypothetical protein [Beggiatoa leptomitoformis]|uniref:hypothetical protein n=1 Tax=Beggiatoa leptomitoformis TaxID=288004 RepID=UPI0011AB12F2|nr:hypothetical protein [Beggiatoa leptomitoformis]ALG67943.2 hypothetical protein AL038_09765 [Beggiatoa leptomitoformis]